MKRSYIIAIVAMAVATTVAVVSCKKEKETLVSESVTEEFKSFSVYYNGELMESFSEIDYTPTKGADMDLTSIVDTNSINYFDQDALFKQFCKTKKMDVIYENNSKLELIHQKALELGIVDNDDDTIPQGMADYWQNIFGSDMHSMMEPNRALLIELYDGYLWDGDAHTYCWPFRGKLKNMDNRTSSLSLYIGFGATVMCYDKWFGGKKKWYWLVGYQGHFSLGWPNLQQDDNQYSSYICFLI